MSYSVKELFYTLQGEGMNVGRPAVFLRFAGCNLWNGLEKDRHKGPGGCSLWCDTDFVGIDGQGGGRFPAPRELALAVKAALPPAGIESAAGDSTGHVRPLVVCTGGEPLLQLDEPLVEALHNLGFEIAIETNGTQNPPPGIDWICVSPKANAELVLKSGDELKLIYPQERAEPTNYQDLDFKHFLLQPMDGTKVKENTQQAIEYCMDHPMWRLSLQTHKFLGIP